MSGAITQDTHVPCPVCGKPFETFTPRIKGNKGLLRHIELKQDEAHQAYRQKLAAYKKGQ